MWALGAILFAMAGNSIRGRSTALIALPAILIAGWMAGGWQVMIAAAFGFEVWQTFPWGHLIGLGKEAPDRPEAPVSILLKRIMGGSVHGALALGHTLFIIPACVFLWIATGSSLPLVLPVAFGCAVMGAYVLAWKAYPLGGPPTIMAAEAMTGIIWGILLTAS